MPNFRMPTLDDIVGNLGEPLDFDVEHRLDGEDEAQDGGADADALQDVAGASRGAGIADIEAAGPSDSGSGSAEADVLGVDGILEEVCPTNSGRLAQC